MCEHACAHACVHPCVCAVVLHHPHKCITRLLIRIQKTVPGNRSERCTVPAYAFKNCPSYADDKRNQHHPEYSGVRRYNEAARNSSDAGHSYIGHPVNDALCCRSVYKRHYDSGNAENSATIVVRLDHNREITASCYVPRKSVPR